jgi:hypothetical protein
MKDKFAMKKEPLIYLLVSITCFVTALLQCTYSVGNNANEKKAGIPIESILIVPSMDTAVLSKDTSVMNKPNIYDKTGKSKLKAPSIKTPADRGYKAATIE